MTEPANRWWYCRDCLAINDGLEVSECWNCGKVQRKAKNFPWCRMGREKCDVCGKTYVVWGLPPGTSLTEWHDLGFCIDYFDHYGKDAYYPPMLPLAFILEGNGWRYDEKRNKVVKVRQHAT